MSVPVETNRLAYGESLNTQAWPSSEVLGFQPNPDTPYQTGDIAECMPLLQVFTRLAGAEGMPPGGWTIIVFRSRLNPEASDEAKAALWVYDANAYDEATTLSRGSLLDYLKGFADSEGNNMSMCIWDDEAQAHQTVFGPKHQLAVGFARKNKVYQPGSVKIEEYKAQFIAGELVLLRLPSRGNPHADGHQS